MSALIARINQSLTTPVGFINPLLYENPQDSRDIVSGNNNGFSAATGWDPCTGMGAPIGTELQSLLTTAVKKKIAA
jgi:kumamolisin